jgi:hypothetical protein
MWSRLLNFLFSLSFLVFSAASLWLMRIEPSMDGIPINFEKIFHKGQFENNVPLKRTYTGNLGLDALLSGLVIAFLPGTAGWEAAVRLQQINFVFNFFSIVCIWNIEACRQRNRWRVISL